MFNTILWATDGSANGDLALDCAKRLTEQYGASLRVVHVVEKPGGGRIVGHNTYLNENAVITKLKSQTSALRRHGFNASLHVIRGGTGQPAHQIADIAREVDADLVIVGTRGRSPAPGAVLGSVTQRLLHVASCPVLAVPPAETTCLGAIGSIHQPAAIPA